MARGPVQEISAVTHNLEQAVELARADNLSAFVYAGREVRTWKTSSGLTYIKQRRIMRTSDAERGVVDVGPPSEL